MSTPFTCPVCHAPLAQEGRSLVCPARHTFDIARQGYVNLLLKKPDTVYEEKPLFAARRAVYEAGFFDPIIAAIDAALGAGRILDAGCGEGSALGRLTRPDREGVGLDISRAAVQMAAATFKEAAFCVGDLCNLPLGDASLDAILNILTPANYAEFTRTLVPGGRLLKVVPGAQHLAEIRAATGKAPYTHTLDEALSAFLPHFEPIQQTQVQYTFAAGTALAKDVFTMTPMTAHSALPSPLPTAITVDVTLLVGARR